MQTLNQDIKEKSFSNIYLLYGAEEFLKTFYKNKLIDCMIDRSDTMNYSYFEGKDVNPAAIIDLAETMPFFKDYRVILIENSGLFKTSNDEFADYLKGPSETSRFIFVEREVDKRSKMYKAAKASGRVVEMVTPSSDYLIKWAAGLLAKNGRQVTQSTLERLMTRSGTDMNSLHGEIMKLIDYTDGRSEITKEDVDAITTVEIRNHIFDMVDAISDGRQKEALDMYYELLSLKEAPMRIIFLIARQFNLLLEAKELMRTSRDNKYIGEKLSLPPFIVRKYIDRARTFSDDVLYNIVKECVSYEEAVKTGKLDDRLSVELLIVKLSGQTSKKR